MFGCTKFSLKKTTFSIKFSPKGAKKMVKYGEINVVKHVIK